MCKDCIKTDKRTVFLGGTPYSQPSYYLDLYNIPSFYLMQIPMTVTILHDIKLPEEFSVSKEEKMKLLWLDLETTGLDPLREEILEVGCVLTDELLEELAYCRYVIKHPPDVLDQISTEYVAEMHKKSGLIEECRREKLVLYMVEVLLIEFIQQATEPGEKVMLAGNSIHFDRAFLKHHMKSFDKMFDYRMLDVSAIKTMMETHFETDFKKEKVHRAMADIEESIKEYKHYLEVIREWKIQAENKL